jgi:hypothetical protein
MLKPDGAHEAASMMRSMHCPEPVGPETADAAPFAGQIEKIFVFHSLHPH